MLNAISKQSRDMPYVCLRGAILDAVEAHQNGYEFPPSFIEECRDQLSKVYDELKVKEVA